MADEIPSFREDLNQIATKLDELLMLIANGQDIIRELELTTGKMACEEAEMEKGSANAQLRLLKVNSDESTGEAEGLEVSLMVKNQTTPYSNRYHSPSQCQLSDLQLDHNLFHGEGEVPVCINIPCDSFPFVNVEHIWIDRGSSKWDPGGMSLQIEVSLVGLDSAYKVFDKITTPSMRAQMVVVFSINACVPFAWTVFDKRPNRSFTSWNCKVAGYAPRKQQREALCTYHCEANWMPGRFASEFCFDLMPLVGSCQFVAIGDDDIKLIKAWEEVYRVNISDAANAETVKHGIKLDSSCLSCVLYGSSEYKNLDLGLQIQGLAIKLHMDSSVNVGTASIDLYVRCEKLQSANLFLNSLPVTDTASFNAILTGFNKSDGGGDEDAMHLFNQLRLDGLRLRVEEMVDEGFLPDKITVLSVLQACSYSVLWSYGLSLFKEMELKYGIRPLLEHFSCMVDFLGKAERFAEAMDLMNESPFSDSLLLWRTLVHACKVRGDLNFGKMTSKHLLDLESKNAGSYLIISNAYALKGATVAAVDQLLHDRYTILKLFREHLLIAPLDSLLSMVLVLWTDTLAEDFKNFYPTTVLKTGHDILFFWVVPMVVMGIEFTRTAPFSNIYLHGLIRDAQEQKMFKTLGNVIDPTEFPEAQEVLVQMREGNQNLNQVLFPFDPGGIKSWLDIRFEDSHSFNLEDKVDLKGKGMIRPWLIGGILTSRSRGERWTVQ